MSGVVAEKPHVLVLHAEIVAENVGPIGFPVYTWKVESEFGWWWSVSVCRICPFVDCEESDVLAAAKCWVDDHVGLNVPFEVLDIHPAEDRGWNILIRFAHDA